MNFDSLYAALMVLLGGLLVVGPDQLLVGPGGRILASLIASVQAGFLQLFSPLFWGLGVLNSIPQMLQSLL